eukprot:scaffold7041_cov311-Pinguiococcus_pyrenoidosus.AAC.11
MEVYADSIGLAFQVADDILDVTATSEELGMAPRMMPRWRATANRRTSRLYAHHRQDGRQGPRPRQGHVSQAHGLGRRPRGGQAPHGPGD